VEERERAELQRALEALAGGDRRAFHPVFAALWPLLRRFAERALGDAALAEDAAQSALLKLFARAADFDPSRDAVRFALGIAAYECKTARKQSQRRREDGAQARIAQAADGRASPEHEALRRDLLAAAVEALGLLRPADLQMIEAALEGDGAAALGLAPATFRKRVQRAFDRLRAAWRTKHGTD
jgi:RNA polymerase sigma-70 factor (ECF subfamily)